MPRTHIQRNNVIESQEYYLPGDINVICSLRIKKFLETDTPHLSGTYLEFCFTHSLEQVITRPIRVTNQTATLIDHILTNSPDKFSHSGVIDLVLLDHDQTNCTRKTSLPKSHKHNEIFVLSMKRYSAENFLENPRDCFPEPFDLYLCK